MRKVLIIEDELFIQNLVRDVILQHFPDEFAEIQSTGSITEAFRIIENNPQDLLVLDTHLPDGTALDLLRKVEMFDFRVIFLSGHDDYYQQAMHLAAVTFVYKPFDLSDLVIAIEKVFNDISEDEDQKKMEILLSNADQPVSSQTVVFPDVNNGYAVPLSSILYGEAVAGGCIMHLEEEKDIFVPRPLRRYEQMFSDYAFYRCHPLFVVNLQKVEHLEASTHSLILRGGIEIPLGEGKYEQVKLRFSQSGLKTGLK